VVVDGEQKDWEITLVKNTDEPLEVFDICMRHELADKGVILTYTPKSTIFEGVNRKEADPEIT